MNKKITSRLSSLRQEMVTHGMSAYLINGCDPHLGEYVPARWETRSFISGFTGSYGWLAITLDEAVLWTDSRYYLQAEKELEGTGIQMLKARLPETVFVGDWVAQRLNEGDVVGFDGTCYSASESMLLKNSFAAKGLKLEHRFDLLENVWTNRPALPRAKAFFHPEKWAGVSRKEKLEMITREMVKHGAEMTIITTLDELCWAFNIRGNDVDFNPVVLGFGLIGPEGFTRLFIDINKLSLKAVEELQQDGVQIVPYASFFSYLQGIQNLSICIDPDRTSWTVVKQLQRKNHFIYKTSIVNLLKSVKNSAEIEGMKQASVYDGLALLNFQLWLENALQNGKITEWDVRLKLAEFRSKMPLYHGESFYPIVGYKDHGAIVHLHVTKNEANTLEPEGMLLFDSGGQYECGTTDITRTIALGPVSDDEKTDFTLALKGMIALCDIRFPKGTIGCHLDVLARRAMWMHHRNYGHGTAHGVGAFLNVHEGPQSIRLDFNNLPICPGNVMSDEPGLYCEGKYGVRTENMMVCVEDGSSAFGDFLRFDTLTMFPIDTRLIQLSLLEKWEINWINNYHKTIYETLAPLANEKQLELLCRLTQSI